MMERVVETEKWKSIGNLNFYRYRYMVHYTSAPFYTCTCMHSFSYNSAVHCYIARVHSLIIFH